MLRQIERNRTWLSLRNAAPFEAVAAGVGLLLRLGRFAYRYVRARRRLALTRDHLRALASSVAWIACALPRLPLARYDVRVARRRYPDGVVRRFVESHPRGSP